MSNDYFDSADYTAAVANTLARASTLNNIVAAIEAAFDKLPGQLALLQNRVTYVEASGPTNYAVTLSPAPSAYADGLRLTIKFANASEGAVTINVNELGAVAAYGPDGTALGSGDITEAMVGDFIYLDSAFRMLASAAAPAGSGEN